jgi:hypothetical protein
MYLSALVFPHEGMDVAWEVHAVSVGFVLFCFVLTDRGLTRPRYAGQKKSQILSSWTKPPFEAPQSLLSPNPPYARKRRRNRRKAHTQSSTNPCERRLDGVQLVTLLRTPQRRSKEILEWCLDGILLIPLANIRIFQEIQHQSFILEKIHHRMMRFPVQPLLLRIWNSG